jgi:zona occludens toxin
MSIKCYWGSNGSYKSASAVEYDIIPELLNGRIVVTNIRGCTLAKCIEQYPEIPESADVIYIDTAVAGSMDKLQKWFRWAPHGALIVIDEVQNVHRSSWRERDLEKFILEVDVNGHKRKATYEEAEQLGQPYDFLDAFTRHRHFNWDLVLTTPNIKYVRSDIRNTTEVCYRQANGALLGFKGRFKRSMHDADENKPSSTSLTQTLKINQKTFRCYDSTSTGKVQDTRAGTNIFKSPQLLLALACALGAFCYSYFSGGFDAIGGKPAEQGQAVVSQDAKASSEGAAVDTKEGASSAPDGVSNLLSHESIAGDDALINQDVFAEYDASISYFEGFSSGKVVYFLIQFDKWKENGRPFSMSSGELISIGYRFRWLSECAVMLYFGESQRLVTCWHPVQKNSEIDVDKSLKDGAAEAL